MDQNTAPKKTLKTVIHPYGEKRKSKLDGFEKTRTKQSFKKECDINEIMAKYQRSGILTHLAKYSGEYGDHTVTDLMDAMNTLREATEMYEALPSSVRKRFADPAAFLEFCENEENLGKLREWGLANPPEPEPEPLLVRVQNGDSHQENADED